MIKVLLLCFCLPIINIFVLVIIPVTVRGSLLIVITQIEVYIELGLGLRLVLRLKYMGGGVIINKVLLRSYISNYQCLCSGYTLKGVSGVEQHPISTCRYYMRG